MIFSKRVLIFGNLRMPYPLTLIIHAISLSEIHQNETQSLGFSVKNNASLGKNKVKNKKPNLFSFC
jgi:hypothetical protein